MTMRISRVLLLFFILQLLFLDTQASAQDKFYWDFPRPLVRADGARFPQILTAGGRLAILWQEFQGEAGDPGATTSVRVLFSADGLDWDADPVTIAENIPYVWRQEVPLFSVVAGEDGLLTVAVAAGDFGIRLFQERENGTFMRTATIPPEEDAANVPVAPRLFLRSGTGFILFLTRHIVLNTEDGALETLTIFTTESSDGFSWKPVESFIDQDVDRGRDGVVLEQNFLPAYLMTGGSEYTVFQTIRVGPQANVYQLYLKRREVGGNWEAALPLTELMKSSPGTDEDPLNWDNQRPFLGLSAEGEILLAWERRLSRARPSIAVASLGTGDRITGIEVEDVNFDRYLSAFPQVLVAGGETWILWFDDTGVRIARRNGEFSYNVQSSPLNAQIPDADRGSVSFPMMAVLGEDAYFVWQDFSGGRSRAILLSPDVHVDIPRLRRADFTNGSSGRAETISVDWFPSQDSSGILSHSWLWSRNPQAQPSRDEEKQIYTGNRATYTLPGEGDWYFTLIAADQAGNWSQPLRLTYTLDLSPPPPPVVDDPPTDTYGYLSSNSFTLSWDAAGEEPVESYRWRMDYLGAASTVNLDTLSPEELSETYSLLSGSAESSQRTASWNNLDNGVWAFTVAALDGAGNQSLPVTRILLTRQYVPVTFISGVSVSRDDVERITLRLLGRGFSAGAPLSRIVLDQDGEPPWDYEYLLSEDQIRVLSDRVAEVPHIEDLYTGEYRIGVEHPLRGMTFWDQAMRLDNLGTVKFGPFDLYSYESLWKPAAGVFGLSGNVLLLIVMTLLAGGAFAVTLMRFIVLSRESRLLVQNARALLTREPLAAVRRKELTMALKKKGMGLRFKFTLALTSLVLIVILIVAMLLGFVWIRAEREILIEGLVSESSLLTETLASGARRSIPEAVRSDLLQLPDRINALDSALWTTITGPMSETTEGSLRSTDEGWDYVWASNDAEVLKKLVLPETLGLREWERVNEVSDESERSILNAVYPIVDGEHRLDASVDEDHRKTAAESLRLVGLMPGEIRPGEFRLHDELSDSIESMRLEVEQDLADAGIDRMINELSVLENEILRVLQEVDFDFGDPVYQEASDALDAQNRQIENLFQKTADARFFNHPSFGPETFVSGEPDVYVFYKPLLYRMGRDSDTFFRGVVRLAVSVKSIRESLTFLSRRIALITVGASVAALLLGMGMALFISAMMLRPINVLIRGLREVSDQPDKERLKDFDVSLNTGDELAGLADTINQMVDGLVKAAVADKELMLGKDIQKNFIPLEEFSDHTGTGKLTTGGFKNDFIRIFGYYEGAKGVSGDYFDFRPIDEDHFAIIKCDISGKGVSASLIMVEVATIFINYFRDVKAGEKKGGKPVFQLDELAYAINDLLNEVGFEKRFAAFSIVVINIRSGQYWMTHAGDKNVHLFNGATRVMDVLELNEAPAAGPMESSMIRSISGGYRQFSKAIKTGDVLFLFTDGIEESQHIVRQSDLKRVKLKELGVTETSGRVSPEDDFEEFGISRIHEIITAVMNRTTYSFSRAGDPLVSEPFTFDFSTLAGSADDAVLALVAVEKIFRLIPTPTTGETDRIQVDKTIDAFLRDHFDQYRQYFRYPVEDENNPNHMIFTHLKEDEQFDDLTILAVEKL